MKQTIITVNEQYQAGYTYPTTEPAGKNFNPDFQPDLSPAQMLKLGIFGGAYFKVVPNEFPAQWFKDVKLSTYTKPDKNLNYFKVNASQPLKTWQQKGWIYEEDPLGWVLWYFRYYRGRRIAEEDLRQIKRWKAMNRHIAQLQSACLPADLNCRPKQRQALLHWAYDTRKI